MFKLRLLFFFIAVSSFFYPTFSWSQCTPNQVIEAVVNGDFEDGYMAGAGSRGFTSDLTYVGDYTPLGTCRYSIANQYAVAKQEPLANMSNCTSNARQTYAGPDYINIAGGFRDHTPGLGGDGFALIGDFENYGGSKWDTDPAGLPAVWRQQVTIQANQRYYFSAWFANYNRDASIAGYNTPELNFIVVPMIGATPQWGARANLGTATPTGQMNWQQFSGVWIPGSAYTSAMLLIEVQSSSSALTNDIALDDISFINGCDNLTSLPAAYVPDLGDDFSLCTVNGAATLNSNVAASATNQFWWYEGTGTTQTLLTPPGAASSTAYTHAITTPGTYRVCVQNAGFPGGCSSSSTVVVTNTMLPVTLDNQNICTASTVTLTAELPSGATYSGTGLTYAWTRPSGAPASVNSPTYTTSGDCSGATKSFTLASTTGSGNTYGWYDAATGGNLKTTGNPGTVTYTAAQVPTTVYLENYNSTIIGPLRGVSTGNDGGGGASWNGSHFTAIQNFTIESIWVSTAFGTGTATITYANSTAPGVPLGTATQVIAATDTWYQVPVNFAITAGQSYIMNFAGAGLRFKLQTPYSSTAYAGIVTRTPNPNGNSGSGIEWTIRTGAACMRTPFTIDCALPVEFLSFDAMRSGSTVNLDWVTASEVDAKLFIVERSLDGTNFTAIGEVKARNSSSGAVYEFTDSNAPNANAYYRLRQVDFNGDYTYSVIRYVAYASISELTLVPNPAQDVLKIILSAGTSDVTNASVHLFNTLGQELYTQSVSSNQLSQGWNIDLTGFANGTYVVKVITVEGEWIEQLIKE
ncbi:MAG: hypothetical protein K0R51_3138 [Cytophagaceae bacterium]|nr:hypothetical protein [Cytophagaceae bacterium]